MDEDQIKKPLDTAGTVLLFCYRIMGQNIGMPKIDYKYGLNNQVGFWLSGAVVLIAAGIGLFLLYISVATPDTIEASKSWEVQETSLIEWMERSAAAELRFERDWKSKPDAPDVYDALNDALTYQYKIRAFDPGNEFGSITRLDYLQKRLEDTRGKSLYTTARANTVRAMELIEKGDHLSAIPLLRDALVNQEWINSRFPDGSLADGSELIRLQRLLEKLEAMDGAAEVQRLSEAARAAYDVGDWELAKEHFDRAITIQESINLNMPDSSLVRWKLVQELKDRRRLLEAAELNQRIEGILKTPGLGNNDVRRALLLQLTLNERFPNSAFHNSERVDELRKQLYTESSRASVELLIEQQRALNAFLAEGNWDEVRSVVLELENSISDFEKRFPLSLLPDMELKDRTEWLVAKLDRLPDILSHSQNRLKEHPGGGFLMYETEVDQALYEMIMQTNPSRWKGEFYPVDSVGLAEVSEFCKRMGWVMGRPVVLPRKEWLMDEGLVDVGDSLLWFASRSEFKSQPVKTSDAHSGFYDVYGNLAEWVQSGEENEVFYLFGGSGADSYKEIINKPVTAVAPNFRSRWVGFRFCVLD